jgi:23S rRNA G2069 N7-methylase RlmK/C1962 C5-methylase RlmI
MAELILWVGKEHSLLRRHPWLFDGATHRLRGRARVGDTVTIFAHDSRALGKGTYSPHSRIRCRAWSFNANEIIDDAFFKRRVAAVAHRIDSSGPAFDCARANLALNPQLPTGQAEWLEADVFQTLRDLRQAGRGFDRIVLDPPKFAPSATYAQWATRAYKDINLLGVCLLNPGGLLMSYFCSGGIGLEFFQKIVAGAALDAGRNARIVARLFGAADHPVALDFPEGEHLKGLLCSV